MKEELEHKIPKQYFDTEKYQCLDSIVKSSLVIGCFRGFDVQSTMFRLTDFPEVEFYINGSMNINPGEHVKIYVSNKKKVKLFRDKITYEKIEIKDEVECEFIAFCDDKGQLIGKFYRRS